LVAALLPRLLHGNGCRSFWRTNADCAAGPDLLEVLWAEILAVVSRHIVRDPEKITVRMDRGKHVSTLEVDIEVPNGVQRSFAAACGMIDDSDIP
jgi:hypothetical protein